MRIEMTGMKAPKMSDAELAWPGRWAKLDHVTGDDADAVAAVVPQRA